MYFEKLWIFAVESAQVKTINVLENHNNIMNFSLLNFITYFHINLPVRTWNLKSRQVKGFVEWQKMRRAKTILHDYLQNTTIHGWSYVGNCQLNISERTIWGLITLALSLFSIYEITKVFEYWNEKPVLTTVDSMAYPLSKERFPTVTGESILREFEYQNICFYLVQCPIT